MTGPPPGAAAGQACGVSGVELISHRVLPGKALLDNIDGACSVPAPPLQYLPLGPSYSGAFYSHARRRNVGYTIAYPPGHRPGGALPLVVMLHGFGGILRAGHDIVFLQADRDLAEAGHDLTAGYTWDRGLPEIDALFLEWRWPIPRRNTLRAAPPGTPVTCTAKTSSWPLTRSAASSSPVVWDKDLQLPASDPLRRMPQVTVCEAALFPPSGAVRLLFPACDAVLDAADPAALATAPRPLPLAYAGNQYDRDEAFGRFFAPAAACFRHRVAGKWTRTAAWPQVNFTGRCPFPEVGRLYRTALATVLLVPGRYARAGQMTQRLAEAVLAGCLPITPAAIAGAATFTPPILHAADGQQVIDRIQHLRAIAGTAAHASMIARCLEHLSLFRLSRQVAALDHVLSR